PRRPEEDRQGGDQGRPSPQDRGAQEVASGEVDLSKLRSTGFLVPGTRYRDPHPDLGSVLARPQAEAYPLPCSFRFQVPNTHYQVRALQRPIDTSDTWPR